MMTMTGPLWLLHRPMPMTLIFPPLLFLLSLSLPSPQALPIPEVMVFPLAVSRSAMVVGPAPRWKTSIWSPLEALQLHRIHLHGNGLARLQGPMRSLSGLVAPHGWRRGGGRSTQWIHGGSRGGAYNVGRRLHATFGLRWQHATLVGDGNPTHVYKASCPSLFSSSFSLSLAYVGN